MEIKKTIDQKTILSDNRSYFIGDRVVLTQIMMFLIAGGITFLIEVSDTVQIIVPLWWLFCLILPLGSIIFIAVKKDSLYFDYSWKALFWLLVLIWVPLTVYLGALIDDAFAGNFNAFWLSIFLALIYTTGYWLAKFFRIRRQDLQSRGIFWQSMILISVIIIVVTSVIGGLLYSSALQASGLDPFAFFEILSCHSCVMSVYIIITGIGIVVAMALHYFMLYCLFEPAGLSVDEDPPNHCYLRIMIVSMIIMFICWILMLILFPPIAGGGGGSGGKGSRRRAPVTRTHRRYATYRTYGQERYPPDKVEDEWKEYGLGKGEPQEP